MGLFKPNIKKLKANKDVEQLIKCLQHKEKDIRLSAAEALGEIKDTRAVRPLITALEDEDGFVEYAATQALREIGEPAVEILAAALKDEHSRSNAIKTLEKVDPKWPYKEVAKRALPDLISALRDEDYTVRIKAVETLAKIKDALAVEPLIGTLLIGALKKEDEDIAPWIRIDIKCLALLALNEIDPKWTSRETAKSAIGGLVEIMYHSEFDIGRPIEGMSLGNIDRSYYVRWSAGDALGKIGAMECLIDALKCTDRDVRGFASYGLGVIGAAAVEPLISILKSASPGVQRDAIITLGCIKDTRAVEPLIAALRDKDSDVRWRAAEALGKIKDTRAVAALRDKDSDVRQRAAEALGEITVKFEVYLSSTIALRGNTIYMSGNFNDWNVPGLPLECDVSNLKATLTLDLPAGYVLEYKYHRGSFATVEKKIDGSERDNRRVKIDKCYSPIKDLIERWADEPEPANADAWNDRGTYLASCGWYEIALKCFEKAIEMNANHAPAWHNKVASLYRLGRVSEAAGILSRYPGI